MAKPRIFMVCLEDFVGLSGYLVIRVDANGNIQAETSQEEFLEVQELEENPEAAD